MTEQTPMADKLPGMADADLKALLANAVRLSESGAPKQKEAASALAPLIQAEMADRKAKLPVPEKKPRKAPVKKVKAAPVVDEAAAS